MNRKKGLLFSMLAVLICVGVGVNADAKNKTRYRYYDLGTLGGDYSWSTGINNWGQVVGGSETENGRVRAFLHTKRQMKDLGILDGDIVSGAWSINDRGQVVGSSLRAAFERRAVLWDRTGMNELENLGGTFGDAFAINRHGEIVGQSTLPDEPVEIAHAVLWGSIGLTDMNPFDSDYSGAFGINTKGDKVGSYVTSEGLLRAVRWTKKGVHDLGTLGGDQSEAYWINDKGETVGWCELPGGDWHACLWTPHGDTIDLGALDGLYSVAYSINDRGQVVGVYYLDDGEDSALAFLWTKKEGMQDLNTLVDLPEGVLVAEANSINDFGWIAGTTNHLTACLLIPVKASCKEPKGHERGGRSRCDREWFGR